MTLYRRAAWVAGSVVAACVAVLLADYTVASWRAPRDDRLVKALQEQVKNEATLAPKLEAEQKRITDARLARKARDGWVGWVLIAASAAFLGSAKKVTAKRPPARSVTAVSSGGAVAARERPAAAPAELDLSFVERAVATHGRGKESAILLLQAIQTHYRYLPDEALRRVCELTEITPAQIAGTSSFYGQFRRSPVGKHVVRICHGTACHVNGARQITDELRRHLAIADGADTDPSRTFTLDEVACLGCCSLAPVLMVDGHTAGRLTPATAREALDAFDGQEKA